MKAAENIWRFLDHGLQADRRLYRAPANVYGCARLAIMQPEYGLSSIHATIFQNRTDDRTNLRQIRRNAITDAISRCSVKVQRYTRDRLKAVFPESKQQRVWERRDGRERPRTVVDYRERITERSGGITRNKKKYTSLAHSPLIAEYLIIYKRSDRQNLSKYRRRELSNSVL